MKKRLRNSMVVTVAVLFCYALLPVISNSFATSFKHYAANQFNADAYTAGMNKIGHNTLAWVNPTADFSRYDAVTIIENDDRYLPVQNTFSYTPFVTLFNVQFKQALTVKTGGQNSLRVETAVVECNPGNRAARFLVGLGAGKTACAAVCEVYAPGKADAIMRIYTRDTGSFGGDSVSMLNHILTQLAIRAGAAVKDQMGK
ncbi:MAG: DUF4410 domain-containing protein [Desulfobacterales bacterium]|jgi:hypothetical protein|nr:DUF4410 domain-containing protein [Desulfobacterales bacterium]